MNTLTYTTKQKFIAWILIISSYLFTFVTPMLAGYFLLAQDKLEEASKGGFFYFLIIGIFGGGLVISLMMLIGKQKANLFKTGFRFIIKTLIILMALKFVNYIDYNISALIKVLFAAAGGFLIGSIIEGFAVAKYKGYIREVGAF